MPDLRQLREERTRAATRIRELADRINTERRDFRADERTDWERVNNDYNRLVSEIQVAERAAQVDRDGNRPVGDRDIGRDDSNPRADRDRRRRDNVQATEEQRSLALRAWACCQSGRRVTRQMREACRVLRFDPRSPEIELRTANDQARRLWKERMSRVHPNRRGDLLSREVRANMSAQLPGSGGYLVAPGTLSAQFELNMLAFGGVRQVADEFTTSSGEPFIHPTVDDTGNLGVQLGENTQAMDTGVNPTLGQKQWFAYKFSSTPVLIPSELLEDDQYDLESQLGEMLGIRLGRRTAVSYATGSGSSTPEGIVTGATLGVTAASATKIAADEIIRLIHSIDPAYRSQPGVGFLMHDQIILALRLLKDGEGRYLWQPGLQDNVPDRLSGYPVNICQEMDSTVATTKKTILFGLLSKYRIRKVGGVRLYRLQERFRDLDQDGFVAFIREDGKLLQAGTPPVKYLQQA